MIDGQAVDLSPLFHWWTNHQGARPLTAWVHVSGSIVGTNAWGWTLEARVEPSSIAGTGKASGPNSGQPRLILKNPPLQDRAQFESLADQLNQLEEQHRQLSEQLTNATNQSHEIAAQQKSNRQNRVRSRALAQEAQQVKQMSNQDQSDLKALDKQLQEVRARLAVYSNAKTSTVYTVDCLALETGLEYNGVPVYDHGSILR